MCLIGCNRASQDKEAVRQAIMDHLKARGMNVAQMDVNVTAVQFNGDKAEATVAFAAKGAGPGQEMTLPYQLEKQGDKWVAQVKSSGGMPHGGIAPGAGGAMPVPGAENPHGSMSAPSVPSPHGGAQMPSPESLPPAGTKK